MLNSASQKIKRKYTQGTPGHVANASYFYFDTAPNDSKSVAIVCGGHERCAPDYHIRRQNYPYYFIKYTLAGRGTLQTKAGSQTLGAGMLTAFAPGQYHDYTCDPGSPLEHIFITFIGHDAQKLLDASGLLRSNKIDTAVLPGTSNLILSIFHAGVSKQPYAQQICSHLLQALLLSVADSNSPGALGTSLAGSTYEKCKLWIDQNFSNVPSPVEAAQACGVHVKYLAALFKKFGTTTPHKYITSLKMNKAANLLLCSNSSIADIAAEVGYSDPCHFSRNFTKFHNCSPSAYRKRVFTRV